MNTNVAIADVENAISNKINRTDCEATLSYGGGENEASNIKNSGTSDEVPLFF